MASRKRNRKAVVVPANFMLVGQYCVAEVAQYYPVKQVNKKPATQKAVATKVSPIHCQQCSTLLDKEFHLQKEDCFTFVCRRYGDKNWNRGKGHDPRHKNHKATQPTIYHH